LQHQAQFAANAALVLTSDFVRATLNLMHANDNR